MLYPLRAATLILLTLANLHAADRVLERDEVVSHPKPYTGPLRNPLMGFQGPSDGRQEYATLSLKYVKWNAIENSATDSVARLITYSDTNWMGVEQRNIKIIPRVLLESPKGSGINHYWPINSYWPDDLPRDFDSAQFKKRLLRMIAKMGEAWDRDSRVAFIEMGIIGAWGEQHHPSPNSEMQKLLGDAFERAFKHKLVMVRYPWQFADYPFGTYWDSFGNPGWEMRKHVPEFEGRLSARWKIAPMGGEMSFASDPSIITPRLARTPTEAVAEHADTLIRYIRRWHWTALGWVSNYDTKDSASARGAARIQSTFGYRFVIDEVRYSRSVKPGGQLSVAFTVRNLGSAPMYYNWPVEVSLLDQTTREPVWKATFSDLDIRTWLPGDFSDKGKGRRIGDKEHTGFGWDTGLDYDIAPATNLVKGTFNVPAKFQTGKYILALAILDPAGNLPAVKFAVVNYLAGGHHPVGIVGVAVDNPSPELDPSLFDDPATDQSLHYVAERLPPENPR